MRKLRLSRWLLLGLIPLYFLLLETYPAYLGFLAQQAHLPPSVQCVFPQSLPPNTAYTLYGSLSDPLTRKPLGQKMRLLLNLVKSSEAYVLPIQSQADGRWQVQLPELKIGQWKLDLRTDQGQPLLPSHFLRIEAPLQISLQADRSTLLAGETLLANAHLAQNSQALAGIPLEFRLLRGQRVLARKSATSNAFGQASVSLQSPAQIPVGSYQLQLYSSQRLLTQTKLEIVARQPNPTTSEQGLVVAALVPQVLKGHDQTLLLSLRDRKGHKVPTAWLRYLGKNLAIQGEYAALPLTAQELQTEIELTAGDSRGHLQQIKLSLDIKKKGIVLQPQLNAQGLLAPQWQIYSAQKDILTYAWGQDSQLLGQAQISLQKGANRLVLPLAKNPEAHWLLLYLASESEPLWYYYPGRSGSLPIELSPAHPDALNALNLKLPALPGWSLPLELSSLQMQQKSIPISKLDLKRPYLGATTQVASASPWLYWGRVIFYLFMAVLACIPLLWFLSLSRQTRATQATVPFPSQKRLRHVRQSLFSVQCSLLGMVFSLLLSWLEALQLISVGFSVPGLIASLALFLLWLTLLWRLAQEWSNLHKWGPVYLSLWALGQLLLSASLQIYFAALLPALWLSWAISLWLLGQSLRLSFFPAGPRREDYRQAWLLSSLVILSLLHPVLIMTRGAIYFQAIEPEVQAGERILAEVTAPAFMTYPLQYQQKRLEKLPTQMILPPAFSQGQEQLRLTLRDTYGQSHSWLYALETRPAVIPQFFAPRYALQGDQLQLALDFNNQTAEAQTITYRFGLQELQSLSLAAGENRRIWQPFQCSYTGTQKLVLEQVWQGRSVKREQEIYVQGYQRSQNLSSLQFELQVPAYQGLVMGEEVPVILKLSHNRSDSRRLGIQLGIPSGYLPLLDTLHDTQTERWLASVQVAPGYINLETKALPPGQELSFHYRLRVQYPGKVQMPAAQLFFMDQPQQRLVDTQLPVFEALPK
jgi:hypothetical protein